MVQEMQAVGGSIQMGFDSQFQGSDREINHHGGILLSVHCDSSEWTKRAKEILDGDLDGFIEAYILEGDEKKELQTPARANGR